LNDELAAERHLTQYFEMFGHRSIYHDGWKAVCPYPGPSLAEGAQKGHPFGTAITEAILDDLEENDWELYHLAVDPAECHNVAADHPDQLEQMRALWWHEAEQYGVLPLSASGIARMFVRRPSVGAARKVYELYPGGAPISFAAAPRVNNRAHAITAKVHVPNDGAEGVLLSHGNRHGGYALYVAGDRLHFVHNYLSLQLFTVSTTDPLPRGDVEVRMEFAPNGPARFLEGLGTPAVVCLIVNGELAGSGDLPYTVPSTFSTTGLSCGWAYYDSVDPTAFQAPFRFTGTIHKVTLDLTGELSINPNAEIVRMMTEQ
jgi:arylsulfatase